MLQNKTNTLKTAYSLPSSRYYRSVKYKVSHNSVAKVQNLTQMNLSHNNQVSNRTATNWRRPTSYSLSKQPKTKDITTAHYENVQEAKPSEMRMTYMETWDSLLNPIQKLKEIQQKGKGNRVCLPSIIDFDPSNFTSLDPLFLPFEHIQNGIADLKKQLPQPKIQMSQIHHDMINFRQKIQKELEETQAYGVRQFQRLRKMLRVDKVAFQQNIMKFKRNCKDLHQQDEAYRKNFQGTKPRLDKLQIQIFSNRPFELSRNPELDQQFPQKYF